MRGATVLLILLLLLASSAAQQIARPEPDWGQSHGGPGNSGLAPEFTLPFDVHASFNALPEGSHTWRLPGPLAIASSEGVVMLARDDADSCRALHFKSVPSGKAQSIALAGCFGGYLLGYHEPTNALLVCSQGNAHTAAVQAYDLDDGGLLWQRTPFEDFEVLEPPATTWWACPAATLDGDRLWVGLWGTNSDAEYLNHRIVGLDVDKQGSVEVVTFVPRSYETLPTNTAATIQDNLGPLGWGPLDITVSQTGLIISGIGPCGAPDDCGLPFSQPYGMIGMEAILAWMDFEGNAKGFSRATVPQDSMDLEANVDGGTWATAIGAAAIARIGDVLTIVDPGETGVISRHRMEVQEAHVTRFGGDFQAGPIASGDRLYVPYNRGLAAYPATDLESKIWFWQGEGATWRVVDLVQSSRSHIITINADLPAQSAQASFIGTAMSTASSLVALEFRTGAPLQRLETDLTRYMVGEQAFTEALPLGSLWEPVWYSDITMVPAPGGFLFLTDVAGETIVIGPQRAVDSFNATIEHPWPVPDEPFNLTIEDQGFVLRYRVAWGDGSVEDFKSIPGARKYTMNHTFAETVGETDIFVTGFLADATTATLAKNIDVGGAPPVNNTIIVVQENAVLTFMQEQFSAENQDRTWGIIGLLLVFMGATIGLAARTLGRGRVRKGMRELNVIKSIDDDHEALGALQHWHLRQERRLLRGRLTEDQFQLLETRAARLLRSVSTHILAPVAGLLSSAVRRQFEAAMVDGYMDAGEVMRLRNALEGEHLGSADRDSILKLLSVWQE